ncbi:unnamed protein product [Neospora caninum Liverpool]|uniref:Toxoplasma gondii family A protein n=1 Tax=Neospora caninum (strain Liverpool) TaxID=572307 RepID=F0VRL9_NEOCL|nr:uncharacterized protein NCLIV_067910 [Neospora caninum Liverpool]CBZ56367.1 unnamed protein product [Neospora caninum Liverpool]CEL71127.1 TPA: hypothetical protein BN1204_067910 [Neospora caninum Liverpool]|eukprot:XP_003886392.1 uncharacterized protein NCLIV_067910 [Neospora caninum Liverpool]
MESSPLRAFWLTVLIGGFLPCALCDTSDLTAVDPDFTVSIPKDGLPGDLEEVFFLQPAGTLRVIDETGSAVYMPQMSTDSEDGASARIRTDSGDASSETYSAAYAFVNGKCDFTKEIQYKDAFPGYSQPIWVRTASADAAEAKASSGGAVANFTLTNPPEEYLTEVVSFCVRFKTFLASGSSTTTTTTSTRVTTAVKATSKHISPQTEMPGSLPTERPQSDTSGHATEEDPGKDENGDDADQVAGSPGNAQGGQVTTPGSAHASPTDPQHPAGAGASSNPVGSGGDGAAEAHAQSRRLSEPDSPEEAYLTIVVHSAAWGLAGGIGALSAFVLSITFTLWSTF